MQDVSVLCSKAWERAWLELGLSNGTGSSAAPAPRAVRWWQLRCPWLTGTAAVTVRCVRCCVASLTGPVVPGREQRVAGALVPAPSVPSGMRSTSVTCCGSKKEKTHELGGGRAIFKTAEQTTT